MEILFSSARKEVLRLDGMKPFQRAQIIVLLAFQQRDMTISHTFTIFRYQVFSTRHTGCRIGLRHDGVRRTWIRGRARVCWWLTSVGATVDSIGQVDAKDSSHVLAILPSLGNGLLGFFDVDFGEHPSERQARVLCHQKLKSRPWLCSNPSLYLHCVVTFRVFQKKIQLSNNKTSRFVNINTVLILLYLIQI